MELPKTKIKASRKSPKNMIIYGAPKIGKTTVLSQLDDCLILDLEDGSDMVDALKVKVGNLKETTDLVSELGLDSLQVMQVLLKIEDQFDISIPLNNLPNIRTIKDLGQEIEMLLKA